MVAVEEAPVPVPGRAALGPVRPPEGNRAPLRWIAVFKLAKAASLAGVAAAAFGLLGDALRDRAVRQLTAWVTRLAAATELQGVRGALGGTLERVLAALLHWLGDATPTRLEVTGVVALLYAAVLTAEGVGLWLAKPWAEWFSVAVTASLIPFEVWEVARRVTLLRVAVLALNVAVVVYLARRVVRERATRREGLTGAPPASA